jgi:hypothetical protein
MTKKFWRHEDPVVNAITLEVELGGMWEHQRLWWNSPAFIKALVGGYGSGKTLIAAKRAIALALLNAPAPHLQISPSYKIAKRTIIPTIAALLDGKQSLDPHLTYKYNKQDHEFIIKHRGRVGTIWVGSGDDPNSIKGPNVGSAGIDEPFIQPKEVFTQTHARVRDPRAKRRELGMTGTPEELNWGYEICEGKERKKYDISVVHANTFANKALPRDYFEMLDRSYDDKMKLAYLAGQFVNLSRGQVYYGFDRERNVARLEDPQMDLEVGMDFNVNPMSAILFWRNGPHMHVCREIVLPNADTDYMCRALNEIVFDRGHPYEGKCRIKNVYPDASGRNRSTSAPAGQSDFNVLEGHGYELFYDPAGNPGVRDRENAVNAKLCPPRGAPPTLTIDPSCERLIQYLTEYSHERKHKQKNMSHLIDALGYPVSYLYGIHRPYLQVVSLSGH